jgi:uncharacterized protein (DUF1778 family)
MFGSGNKVRIKDSVLRKVRLAAEMVGCPVEDFITKALTKEAERVLSLVPRRDPAVNEADRSIEQQEIL